MNKDIQTFIIWKNARAFEEDILNKIKSNFTILKEYEITWTPELFGENLSAFYGDNFIYNMFQRQVRGEGAFIFVIAEDKNPNYITVTANRGEVQVNEKAFKLKQEIRKFLKTFSFHSSNDLQEARHNIALLLGKNLNDFLSSTEFDGKREVIHQDIPSARGWNSLSEFFYILNETCNYVLLRSFDAIPDSHTYDKNGDIDLLVDDMKKFLAILNPTIPTHKNAFHFFNWEDFGEDNKHLLIHPKFIGDNYYDINMQKKILETRRLNEKGVYVPNDEMYFWTLLHHGVFHKENWQKYDSIFRELAPKINVEYKPDKEYLSNLLTDYMKLNGYKVAKHLDNCAASLMSHNIKDSSIIKSEPMLYCYTKPDDRFFSFVVFSEEAIFFEPELTTEFINQYSIFTDLELHVLDANSYIYEYIKERMQDNEYLWSFVIRKDNISVFSYKNKCGNKSFSKKFLIDCNEYKTDFVNYQKQTDIKYIDCKTKVSDILLENFIKNSYESFLLHLDEFFKELFAKYETKEDLNFLEPQAWDYLPRNVFYIKKDDETVEYLFFDTEAEYNKQILKSQAIANIILDFDDKFYFSQEEKYNLYKYFIEKYSIEDIWDLAKQQRQKEIDDIIGSDIVHKSCYQETEFLIKNNVEKFTNIIERTKNQLKNINSNLDYIYTHYIQEKYQKADLNDAYKADQPLISIIMPIYNSQDFMRMTLDSVISQTLKNIEIICVNDGSTDNSLQILEEYAKKDPRIKIITKENGGQASARNMGIEIAKGNFIGFIDSDDTIPENYYQILYENALNTDADIVHCRYTQITEDGKEQPYAHNNIILLQDYRNSYFNKIHMTYSSGVVWNKIYKRELFKGVRFIDETSPWEDNPFILEITRKANKIAVAPEAFYYYLQRSNSSIHEFNPRVHFKLLKSTEYLINYLNDPKNNVSEEDYKKFYFQIINRMNQEYCKAFSNHKMTKKDRKRYSKIHHRLFFKIKYLSLSDKLNCTNEYQALRQHLKNFLKPFKIIELIIRLMKNIAIMPYYYVKEEILNK